MLFFRSKTSILVFSTLKEQNDHREKWKLQTAQNESFSFDFGPPSISGSTLDEEDSPVCPEMAPCCL